MAVSGGSGSPRSVSLGRAGHAIRRSEPSPTRGFRALIPRATWRDAIWRCLRIPCPGAVVAGRRARVCSGVGRPGGHPLPRAVVAAPYDRTVVRPGAPADAPGHVGRVEIPSVYGGP